MRIGRGTVYKRRNKWACTYWIAGKQFYKGGFDKKSDAEGYLADIHSKKGHGEPLAANAGKLPVEKFLRLVEVDYTINNRHSLGSVQMRTEKHLLPFFGGLKVSEISGALIEEYKQHRLSEEARPATINRELAIFRHAYTLAFQQNLIGYKVPFKMLEENNIRMQSFTEAEFLSVYKNLAPDLQPLFEFTWETGMRIGEAVALTFAQVDFDEEMITLPRYTTKNKQPREFPFTVALRDLLQGQRQEVDSLQRAHGKIIPYVFPRCDGERLFDLEDGQPKAKKYVYTNWRHACAEAGLAGRIPHDLRRSAAINRRNAGVPDDLNMALGGWETRVMLDRYLGKKRKEDLRRAAKMLDSMSNRSRTVAISSNETKVVTGK